MAKKITASEVKPGDTVIIRTSTRRFYETVKRVSRGDTQIMLTFGMGTTCTLRPDHQVVKL